MSERPSIFPSITPDGDGESEPFVDDTYSEAELDRMDGNGTKELIQGDE